MAEDDYNHDATEELRPTLENNLAVDNVTPILTRMDALIDYGLTPSEARSHALKELTKASRKTIADALGITVGAVNSSMTSAKNSIKDAHTLHKITLDQPVNPVAEFEYRPDGPADYIDKFLIAETLTTEENHPNHAPPSAGYIVVTEHYGPGHTISYEYSGTDVERYFDAEAVIEDLYETEYFWSLETARERKHQLEDAFNTTINTSPEDRINPD